jgi:hypothetical protein
MEYICDKIISITKFEKLHIYFKTIGGFFACEIFFMVNDIDIHQFEFRTI